MYGSEILSKNWDIWNPKFQQNSIVYYFFLIFLAFFAFYFLLHLSKLVQNLWNFLWWFIGRVREFTSDFWKILKVLLKNYWYVKYSFFSKFYGLLFVFYFFIIFDIWFFNFVYLYMSKHSRNFYVLFYGLEILSKNFGKSWNVFQKNIDIWNPKFFINSIVYYLFFFYSFIILVMFFSYITYPNLSNNSKHFCGVLLYGL